MRFFPLMRNIADIFELTMILRQLSIEAKLDSCHIVSLAKSISAHSINIDIFPDINFFDGGPWHKTGFRFVIFVAVFSGGVVPVEMFLFSDALIVIRHIATFPMLTSP